MQQMYVYYPLNTIIFRENFSFKLSISAQDSDGGGCENAWRQLRPARGWAGRNGDVICRWWLAEGGGVWGDGGAADDYLVATEIHVDECRNIGYVDHAVVDDICQFQVEWIWIFA